jgi:hypothetical protein
LVRVAESLVEWTADCSGMALSHHVFVSGVWHIELGFESLSAPSPDYCPFFGCIDAQTPVPPDAQLDDPFYCAPLPRFGADPSSIAYRADGVIVSNGQEIKGNSALSTHVLVQLWLDMDQGLLVFDVAHRPPYQHPSQPPPPVTYRQQPVYITDLPPSLQIGVGLEKKRARCTILKLELHCGDRIAPPVHGIPVPFGDVDPRVGFIRPTSFPATFNRDCTEATSTAPSEGLVCSRCVATAGIVSFTATTSGPSENNDAWMALTAARSPPLETSAEFNATSLLLIQNGYLMLRNEIAHLPTEAPLSAWANHTDVSFEVDMELRTLRFSIDGKPQPVLVEHIPRAVQFAVCSAPSSSVA